MSAGNPVHDDNDGTSVVVTYCPMCGYDLRGIPEDRCPECGFGFQHEAVRNLVAIEAGDRLCGYRAGVWLAVAGFTCAFLPAVRFGPGWLGWAVIGLYPISILIAVWLVKGGVWRWWVAVCAVLSLPVLILLAVYPLVGWVGGVALVAGAYWRVLGVPARYRRVEDTLPADEGAILGRWRRLAWGAIVGCSVFLVVALGWC